MTAKTQMAARHHAMNIAHKVRPIVEAHNDLIDHLRDSDWYSPDSKCIDMLIAMADEVVKGSDLAPGEWLQACGVRLAT